jgi:F-type H+-transporting ATPase subunit gamma
MKMVSAAKLRRAQERIFHTRPYSFKIGEIISHLKGQIDPTAHPLFEVREEVKAVVLVVITADRGLAGAFNSNVIKLAEQTIEEYSAYRDSGNLYLICVGRRGNDHFKKRGYQLVGNYAGIFDRLSFKTADKVVDDVVGGYLAGRWDEAKVIYNEFKNTISQNRVVEPFLPIPAEQFLTPVMAADDAPHVAVVAGRNIDYIFEPDPKSILNQLVPRYLNYQLWRALLESNASEQGARMVAMDNATSNAADLIKQMQLVYNRARQSAITKELIEITSGADALEH